jgi:ubiquinone/menaquinone biosynthesis C-methylase UbiE
MENILEPQIFREETRKAFFNQAASNWDNRFCNRNLESHLERLVPQFELRRGEKILDVGTGTGVLIPHLLKATGPSGLVVGVDFAEKMLQICNQKCQGLKNVMVGVQAVERLAFLSESFDVVTCFGLFPHIENKRKALQEMNRVLRQYGKLVIAHALSSTEIEKHHQNAPPAVSRDILPKKENMRRLLRDAGFSLKNLKDEPRCYLCVAVKSL